MQIEPELRVLWIRPRFFEKAAVVREHVRDEHARFGELRREHLNQLEPPFVRRSTSRSPSLYCAAQSVGAVVFASARATAKPGITSRSSDRATTPSSAAAVFSSRTIIAW